MRKRYVVLLSVLTILLICASLWGINRYRNRFEIGLMKRAQAGDVAAQLELANAYLTGWRHIPKDEKAAFDWYSRAAGQNYAKAQYDLGLMYAKGDGGVKKDDVAAFQWFQKAASQDDHAAERQLGVHYAMGVGVPQDYMEAVLWFRKAAEQGDYRSQQLLAAMYADGKGVRRDSVMAYAWCLVVRAEGREEDKDKGRVDRLLKQLTPAQELEAQQLASMWWTSHSNGTNMPEYSKDVQQAASPKSTASQHARPPAVAEREFSVPSVSQTRRGCEAGHWVQSVSDDGGIVTLEDGSVWHISDVDAVDTFTWTPTEDVIVCEGKLVNTDSRDTVEASRLK